MQRAERAPARASIEEDAAFKRPTARAPAAAAQAGVRDSRE